MPDLTFTDGNDSYTIYSSSSDSFNLDFLDGNDDLTINGGALTNAWMGAGDDHVRALRGFVSVDAGDGNDVFDIRMEFGFSFFGDAGPGNDQINFRGGANVTVLGGVGADSFSILGDDNFLTLDGGEGNDLFLGRGHVLPQASIIGGAGDDRFFGFSSFASDGLLLQGGAGNDVYSFDAGAFPNILEQPNEGIDTVQVPLGTTYLLPANVENLRALDIAGSTAADGSLIGNELNNIIVGGDNNDRIDGLEGNDWLYGGGGSDFIEDSSGKNHLDGGRGNDQLVGGDLADTLTGGPGDDIMIGAGGNDTYDVNSPGDVVVERAGGGTDMIWSRAATYTLPDNVENGAVEGPNRVELNGNAANNVLTGGAAGDTLRGFDGNDTIRGGSGDDIIVGGGGADVLTGGTGHNVFVYQSFNDSLSTAYDTILDFAGFGGTGVIDLSAIDADSGVPGNQAFTLVYPDDDYQGPGALYVVQDSGGGMWLMADSQGGVNFDFQIFVGGGFAPQDLIL